MSDAEIDSLCELFVDKLKNRSSQNYHGDRFFPNGSTKEVFEISRSELSGLLQNLLHIPQADTARVSYAVESTIESFSKVFATLLCIPDRCDVWKNQYRRLLLFDGFPDSASYVTDDDLPWSRETASRIFPSLGQAFYDEQFRFCPVTLRAGEEVMYEDRRCPLPYLEETEIGQGSFGRVVRVKLERYHFLSEGGRTANYKRLELARKEFKISRRQAFYEERNTLQQIMNRPIRHESVTVALTSLQYGDTYSLFFPLASCNLWDYLTRSDELGIQKPSSLQEKHAVFCRGVILASALAFLHNEFQNTRSLQSHICYHLDLKPHNILVFDANSPSERWSITDFGLSRVRSMRDDDRWRLETPFFRGAESIQSRDGPSTANRRGEGTYLAPEANEGRLNQASDVWSFGCTFSLVMSFIDCGSSSVLTFSERRFAHNAINDCFHSITNGKQRLSPAVIQWFKELESRAEKRGSRAEHFVFCKTLGYLKSKVLSPARDSRVSARRAERRLSEISRHFEQVSSQEPPDSLLRRIIRRLSTSQSATLQSHQRIPVSERMLASTFSPGGEVLAFYSSTKIEVFAVDMIGQGNEQIMAPSPPSAHVQWECVAISSAYLCACVKIHHFECYISPLRGRLRATADNDVVSRIYDPRIGAIQDSSMSRDGGLIAFVTHSIGPNNLESMVYLFRTEALIDLANELCVFFMGSVTTWKALMDLTSSRCSSLSSPSNSTSSNTLSVTSSTGTNIIAENSELGAIDHIWRLMFSNDNRHLILVAQPYPMYVLIKVWETDTGISCANTIIDLLGYSSSSDPGFTGCSVLDQDNQLFILSQRKNLIPVYSWQRPGSIHSLDGHFVDVLASSDEHPRSLILLCHDKTRSLGVYEVPISDNGAPCTPRHLTGTSVQSYRTSTDSAVLKCSDGKTELLIAKIDGSFFSITLPQQT